MLYYLCTWAYSHAIKCLLSHHSFSIKYFIKQNPYYPLFCMSLKRINSFNKVLLLLNISFALFFLALFARSAYYRLEQKQAVKDSNYSYADNLFYREQTAFYALFHTKANIVML